MAASAYPRAPNASSAARAGSRRRNLGLVPYRPGSSGDCSNAGWSENAARCQPIHPRRTPVSPTGILRRCAPRIEAAVRKTSSLEARGTLPTRWAPRTRVPSAGVALLVSCSRMVLMVSWVPGMVLLAGGLGGRCVEVRWVAQPVVERALAVVHEE